MASTSRPARKPRLPRRLARTGPMVALAGVLSLALPAATVSAAETASPPPFANPARTTTPAPTERPVPLDRPSRPVRVEVPYAGIDLPVVSSEQSVPGNVDDYPLCDVAQYWTKYDLPGEPGTTWIYGHAQPGMFLPLYTISEASDGQGLIGKLVRLQLRDNRVLVYRITEVRERAIDEDIADRPTGRQQRLILQTSTGPPGTIPKLQVAAVLIEAEWATEERPEPQPRACWQPRPTPTRPPTRGTAKPTRKATPTATPGPVEVATPAEPDGTTDALALLVGSGAVLLGATVVAVYIIRRP